MKELYNDLIKWIQDWFANNGKDCKAVIGMSGGKDSTIVATLLVEALGEDRVLGVLMPDEDQGFNEADEICKWLGIDYIVCPIDSAVHSIYDAVNKHTIVSDQAFTNIAPRIRMTILYAIAQSCNGRVIDTTNYSEAMLGYFTLWGDGAGDMSPVGNLTVTELLKLGDYLKIPHGWVHKTPDDGLPNSCPDEEKFGFTYAELDRFLNGDAKDISKSKTCKMQQMINNSQFKRDLLNIPTYEAF